MGETLTSFRIAASSRPHTEEKENKYDEHKSPNPKIILTSTKSENFVEYTFNTYVHCAEISQDQQHIILGDYNQNIILGKISVNMQYPELKIIEKFQDENLITTGLLTHHFDVSISHASVLPILTLTLTLTLHPNPNPNPTP